MPPGPRAHRAHFISTASVLAGGGVALAESLLLRVLMARALEPGALDLVSQASAHGYLPTASAALLLALFRPGPVDVETSSL
ncbi:MAG TPA: hypothetical protein VE129_11145 [Thermoanaerobaculia bacterium]|nr:hypothetical protein [Thermoanaerobaculia bacterium]